MPDLNPTPASSPLPPAAPKGVGWLAEHLPPEERLPRLLHNIGEHFESLYDILVLNQAAGPTREILLSHIEYEEGMNDAALAEIENLLPLNLKGLAAIGRQHSRVVRSFAGRPADLTPDLLDHMLRHFIEEHKQLPGAEEVEDVPTREGALPLPPPGARPTQVTPVARGTGPSASVGALKGVPSPATARGPG